MTFVAGIYGGQLVIDVGVIIERDILPENKLPNELPDPTDRQGRSKKPSKDRESMRWMGYGVEFIGVLGIFTYAGYWADEKLQTKPWLMILAMTVAFVGMIYLLFKETANWRK